MGIESASDRLILRAGGTRHRYWSDLWRYRELFYFLAWRDLLVRYKQTVIGIAWALIRPLLTIVVFTIVFGKIAKLPSGDVPYAVLVCAALLPWQFFSNALTDASTSILANANLVTKVYFPRLIIPATAVVTNLVDFVISSVLLAALMAYYGISPGWRILALPAFTLMAMAAALGFGAWLTALNVKYRDFRYVIPFILTLGLYVSPVGFSSDVIPGPWRVAYSLNPMVGVIDGFRWALLDGDTHIHWPGFLVSASVCLGGLAAGIGYFRATERKFADVI